MIDYIIDYANDAVALRKESVDRNLSMGLDGRFKLVALRKESVDRNRLIAGSLSTLGVALRKESVDRNSPGTNTILSIIGRSPQGERG